jgi:hypothetical protein
MRVHGHRDHRPVRPFWAGQPGGDHCAPLPSRRGSECGVALQPERAHSTSQVGCRGGGAADGPHPLEHRGHRQGPRPFPVLPGRLSRRGQHRGQEFGRRHAAAHLRCRCGPGRGADHQIGGLCHIETSLREACDDTYLPRISGSPAATTENQSNVASRLPREAGHCCRRPHGECAVSVWPLALVLECHACLPLACPDRLPSGRQHTQGMQHGGLA